MTAPTWNFSEIITLTRQVSGQLNAVGLSNDEVGYWANVYYQYDLPRELKIEELYTQYTWTLYPGVSVYDLPGEYGLPAGPFTHVEPKLYIDGQSIFYTQDTNIYYRKIPILWTIETLGYGNGIQKIFPYTTQLQPIVPNVASSVVVTDSIETLSDNGQGLLIDNIAGGTGTVNYTTGAISVTFNTAPALNQIIQITYHYEQLAMPNTVLFYNRQFQFYPTPDTAYSARIDAYFQPQPLVNASDVPIKPEWGEIIAIGGALKILRNFGQFEKYQEVKQYYDIERTKLMSDTDNQLMATRARPTC
jgi:hypothetical protein